MAFYDKERLIEEANAQMVAEYLGMEMRTKGGMVQIKCPGHLKRLGKEDNNFGSCVLTEKGYHCFACHKTVNLVSMVMEVLDLEGDSDEKTHSEQYQEALGIIGDSLGGRNLYVISGNAEIAEERTKALSVDDLELIGLKQSVTVNIIETVSNDKKIIVEDGLIPKIPNSGDTFDSETYLGTAYKSYSLRLLKNADPVAYYNLIKSKAKEAMSRYEKMISACEHTSKDSKIFALLSKNGKLNDEILYDFKHLYMSMYDRCKEIYDEIDDDMCGMESTASEEVVIPNYNLFD